jgi:hypothetical protein
MRRATKLETDRKHFLVFASIFKAENHYLREWLEYHRLVGVDHFYLYDNDGGQAAKELLKPYVEQGLVTRNDWAHFDGTKRDRPTPWGQRNKNHLAFGHAAEHYRHEACWMMKIDIDEFLVPLVGEKSLVSALEGHDRAKVKGVRIPRFNFGDNGHQARPEGLVTASYTRREATASNHKDLANCAFLSDNRHANSAHWWHYKWFRFGEFVREDRVSNLRIHHYYTKSLEEHLQRQNTSRGRKPTEEGFRERNRGRNDVEDSSMLRFVPEIERRLSRG